MLQSNDSPLKEIVCCHRITEKVFEVGGGELDEGLEEVPLLGIVARCLPKTFKDFVALPPVGVVIEVNPIQIIL